MERIGVRELRQHASRYLDLVKTGETVEVTERGELVALLVPAPRADSVRDRLVASGRLIPSSGPSGHAREPRPVTPEPHEPTNAALLDTERDERC